MKNKLLYLFKSKIILKISGKNLLNFIKKVKDNNIDLLDIKYSNSYIVITIYKSDYKKLLKIKTIYDIDIIDYKGIHKINYTIYKNLIIISFILISIVLIYLLSNTIFSIDVITNDLEFREIILKELNSLGIKKYRFKRKFNSLQNIKTKIINKYRSEIEWIEIESIGTKYIIKYEPRIIKDSNKENNYRNIIAKKDSIITKMIVHEGEIIKNINTYVKKGEIIVSGTIYLNEEIKTLKSASGTIYGEVWYKANIKYPLKYYESIETGKKNTIFSLVFLSKRININSKYKTSNITDNIIIKNNILPIFITHSKEKETKIIDESNTTSEAIEKAKEKVIEKINSTLNKGEYIKNYKIINKNITKNYVELDIFFTVIENITDYEEIRNNY